MSHVNSPVNAVSTTVAKAVFLAGALASLLPFTSAAAGLVLGILVALVFGNPYLSEVKKITHHLLAISVVGLGFGMNLLVVARVGFEGIGYTIVGISTALILGTLLGRLLKTSKDVSLLITVGTAICGGSAIAAISPVIRAKSQDVSVALVTVFLLNAVALVLFPPIGHFFGFSESQFGLWAALAIHDTSSVVGATLHYGPHALEVGTTVKLARALWIVPLALAIGYIRSRVKSEESGAGQFKKPWFILGFLLAAALVTWVPSLQPAGHVLEQLAKRTLVLTLFLIGSGLTRQTLKAVGVRPLIQGVALWVMVSTLTFGAIWAGWIR